VEFQSNKHVFWAQVGNRSSVYSLISPATKENRSQSNRGDPITLCRSSVEDRLQDLSWTISLQILWFRSCSRPKFSKSLNGFLC